MMSKFDKLLEAVSPYIVILSSDDGVAMYVNGHLVDSELVYGEDRGIIEFMVKNAKKLQNSKQIEVRDHHWTDYPPKTLED